MAAIAISFDGLCRAGGNHARLAVSLDGGGARPFVFGIDDVLEGSPTGDEDFLRAFVLTLIRLHCAGMTRAQIRTALQAGFTVLV